MNTEVHYIYRDASNYKLCADVVVEGELSPEQMAEMQACCEDGEYFIPELVQIPRLRFKDADTDDDHDFHELESVEQTSAAPTLEISALALLALFQQHKDKWYLIHTYHW